MHFYIQLKPEAEDRKRFGQGGIPKPKMNIEIHSIFDDHLEISRNLILLLISGGIIEDLKSDC